MSEIPLLQINNLRTQFRNENEIVDAVKNISFSLNKGETIGIVGESGSGKSVTSLSVMRLIASPLGKIAEGQLLFNSSSQGLVDLALLPENKIQKLRGNEMAMVFQEPMTSLNPVFTCGYQVMEALVLHKKMSAEAAKKRCIELFREVQLPRPEQIFKSYPHQISGGQKQRVMIAMAICCNPALLIADEPTTALDVTVQKSILELLKKIQKAYKMGILFITHDLGVVAEIADRVVVMYKGKIVEQGSVADIFTNPKHPYTKGLLACRPPLDVRPKRLPTISDFMQVDNNGEIKEIVSSDKPHLSIAFVNNERVQRHKVLYEQEPILKVRNLQTYFPINKGFFRKTTDFVKAVNQVSFDVFPGETLGLVGESGCGKTTLGRSILRLVEPTGGEIIYKGTDLRKLSQKQMQVMRKKIQLVFQDPYSSLNPRITVGKAIMEPMQFHSVLDNDKERKKRVIDLLERVSMNESHFNRYPHEFSGGQRQRICIARALALNPEFIICDESVSALDVSVQAQVLNLLNELQKDFGFSYIFISHDLSVVKFMSDRMVVMNKGEIVESGDADVVYASPQSDYTKKLISAIPKGFTFNKA